MSDAERSQAYFLSLSTETTEESPCSSSRSLASSYAKVSLPVRIAILNLNCWKCGTAALSLTYSCKAARGHRLIALHLRTYTPLKLSEGRAQWDVQTRLIVVGFARTITEPLRSHPAAERRVGNEIGGRRAIAGGPCRQVMSGWSGYIDSA